MAAPNIVNVTTILGHTDVLAVTTSPTDITTNSAASGKVYKINVLTIANVDGTNSADITVSLFRSSVEYAILSTVAVPPDATLVAISKDAAIYLEEGDSLRLTASADSDLVAVCSYEEIS
jgi:hypothetical protein